MQILLMLLRYSITYHYDLMQTNGITVCVAYSNRLPYLDVKDSRILLIYLNFQCIEEYYQ